MRKRRQTPSCRSKVGWTPPDSQADLGGRLAAQLRFVVAGKLLQPARGDCQLREVGAFRERAGGSGGGNRSVRADGGAVPVPYNDGGPRAVQRHRSPRRSTTLCVLPAARTRFAPTAAPRRPEARGTRAEQGAHAGSRRRHEAGARDTEASQQPATHRQREAAPPRRLQTKELNQLNANEPSRAIGSNSGDIMHPWLVDNFSTLVFSALIVGRFRSVSLPPLPLIPPPRALCPPLT